MIQNIKMENWLISNKNGINYFKTSAFSYTF